MCFFHHKKNDNSEKLNSDHGLIDQNAKEVLVLESLSSENPELVKLLQDLEEKLKFLTSSHLDGVVSIDRKISGALDDLKIDLYKGLDEKNIQKVKEGIKRINAMVAERGAVPADR
jgi:hypothetical protein